MRRLALVGVVVVGCGGSHGTSPGPTTIGNEPTSPEPTPPSARPAGCSWAGRLTGTIAPQHGDVTCIHGVPFDIELVAPRSAYGNDFQDVAWDPPAATGENPGVMTINVTGDLTGCVAQLSMSYFDFPMHDRSLFVSLMAAQDSAGAIKGGGTAQLTCNDGRCDCRADVTFEGSIAPN
jgi:hypothetical protein